MLGFLVTRHEGNRKQVLAALPNVTENPSKTTSSRSKISALVETIRDFIGVFEDATRKMEGLLRRQRLATTDDDDRADEVEGGDGGQDMDRQHQTIGSFQGSQRDHEAVNAVIVELERWRDHLK